MKPEVFIFQTILSMKIDLQVDETYKTIIRQSPIAYILATFGQVALWALGGTLTYLGRVWIFYWDLEFHLVEAMILFAYLLIVAFFWWYFWYFTYLLITSHRIEKHSPTMFLGEKKEILWFHEILKIWFFYPSIVARLLRYWTIEITSWDEEKNNIRFENAPEPEKVVHYLKEIKTDYHRMGYDK